MLSNVGWPRLPRTLLAWGRTGKRVPGPGPNLFSEFYFNDPSISGLVEWGLGPRPQPPEALSFS